MTRLLDLIAPYPKGYVPYVTQTRIDLRRAYLRGAVLGLIVGFILGFGTSIYWQGHAQKDMDEFQKESIRLLKKAEAEHIPRREALGDEIARRTIAEMKLRKGGK
jgi:predicted negative regulator of RcsB-dependent stress response